MNSILQNEDFVAIEHLCEVWEQEQRTLFETTRPNGGQAITDQSVCSQALRRARCLWSPPFCGQDGELLPLDLRLFPRQNAVLKDNTEYTRLACCLEASLEEGKNNFEV